MSNLKKLRIEDDYQDWLRTDLSEDPSFFFIEVGRKGEQADMDLAFKKEQAVALRDWLNAWLECQP